MRTKKPEKAGPGRPRVLDSARRVTLNLDEATVVAARKAANIDGVSFSQFCRDAVMSRAIRVAQRRSK